ncbi:MAG: hypothetical protein U0359_14240 [Byssovorax sp.]
MIVRRRSSIPAALLLALLGSACGGEPPPAPSAPPAPLPIAAPEGSLGRIERRQIPARPRLTLISRDGDPTPAIVVSIAADLGPSVSTALAALLEARLTGAGFPVDSRADRDALRVRLLLGDPARIPAFFAALGAAVTTPVRSDARELALVTDRLKALRRNPLDAAALLPVVACTGALGLAPGEPALDLGTPKGLADLESARGTALVAARASIAVVGPAAFTAAAGAALTASPAWPEGSPADDAWPAADAATVLTGPLLDRRSARLTIALRTADPAVAAAAAERLGAADSPLVTRLRALPQPYRVVDLFGVARPRGGCLAVTLETSIHPRDRSFETTAALAAAVARAELRAEVALGAGPAVAGRQILTAADPRDAASRAAWWALSGVAPASTPERWALALALPPADHPSSADPSPERWKAELDRALAGASQPVLERRAAVERGQGELWVLLASPCGVVEEGPLDAGLGAVAMLASMEALRGKAGATVEPWITTDGIGVLAHAPIRDERETPLDLARRVGDAAARAFGHGTLTVEHTAAARASALDLIGRAQGKDGAAFASFAGALSPDHPSWLSPFGIWSKVASAGLEDVRFRRDALAGGPLRLAVLANTDAAEVEAAVQAAERWFSPSTGPRVCRASAPTAPRPGHYDVRLPDGAAYGQALIGAPIAAPGSPAHDLASIAVELLGGEGGALASAFQQSIGSATARILGGSRAPALVIDVHAPPAGVAAASAEVRQAIGRLSETVTEADLARAYGSLERREQEGRSDPRRRLVDLWSGRAAGPPPRPTLVAFRAFLAAVLRESALVVVEARADGT